ncbi:hypothetical protein [Pseudonocardia sp.]|uniref:TetR/AcrR family transcriptional regulator n=1 Tax=Pseudonocardia sp. TaxID=60912 RepID=UPI0039C9C994
MRAALTGAHLLGIATARYVLRIERLASADRESLVGHLAPVVQRISPASCTAVTSRRAPTPATAALGSPRSRVGAHMCRTADQGAVDSDWTPRGTNICQSPRCRRARRAREHRCAPGAGSA